jgi:hypothetical protein
MKNDTIYLRACAAAYLRYRRRCPLISFERASGDTLRGRPDVLGLTKERQWVEIEIKTSVSDLRADMKKRKWLLGMMSYRQFYYLMQPEIVGVAKKEVPDGRGIMTLAKTQVYGLHEIMIVKKAAINRDAPRASTREVVEAVWHQSGTLCGLAREIAEVARDSSLQQEQNRASLKQGGSHEAGKGDEGEGEL